MNKLYRSQTKNNRNGFTLVETMLSLMITAFVILIVGSTFSDVRHSRYHNVMTQFYVYLDAIEDYKVTSYGDGELNLKKGRKNYYVELQDHDLILTTHHGGYMPFLYHVKKVEWHRTDNGLLDHHVIMQNGQQFDGKSRLNE
ncbi:prepilin-type N-terminal cleavage/methylation domain-containing protein [Acetilactobacillus jinshanensis]|uniref:Prepilin-type N-terminal cleavage/methylation domain-containing protein n=1 Tax=Acetilactobacillus jinshanensis TaxID=1720083 RepID=A0A4V1ALT5_9LACO|nr:prepilin-type N-terminal cleavage/methylation domain-containing protein [Acetilactobacillus jinshanensis]QBP18719.1 hypothetical protein ELX58_06310 [Acetilactobacillus jinshanensis]URL61938.1 hypothetical protein HGK75_06455 [uncultured bacterium]